MTNTGGTDSDEVVQVYLKQPYATVPTPTVRLAAFERIHLKAKQRRTITLVLLPETHAVVRDGETSGEDTYGASASQFVEKGELQIFAGGGQPDYYEGHVGAAVQVDGDAAVATCGR